MFADLLQAKSNVWITARDERGKKVPGSCRESHNIWVNNGRQYLAEVIAPNNASYTTRVNDGIVRYIALGIGGADQTINVDGTYPTLGTHYPGQNTYLDNDISINYLERPIKSSGTAGVGSSPGVWMNSVTQPPPFSGSPTTIVSFDALFANADCHLAGAYPAMPLSEVALLLNTELASLNSDQVYDFTSGPAYINAASRQKILAYNTFETITKTVTVALEIHWEIQF